MNINTLKFIGKKLRPVELALFVKWALRIKREQHAIGNGLKFYIDPVSHFGLNLLTYNAYEPVMTREITGMLSEGDTFIDLGSNEGFFAILASKTVGKNGKVFAIEPQQRLWNIIEKNISINSTPNVHLLPYGIGAEAGEAVMNLYASLNSGASSFSNNFNFNISLTSIRKKLYGQDTIVIKTLDELFANHNTPIKLIKIDIEGFEYEALKGAKQVLTSKLIKNLLVEVHPYSLKSMGQSEDELKKYVCSFGYTCREVAENLLLFN